MRNLKAKGKRHKAKVKNESAWFLRFIFAFCLLPFAFCLSFCLPSGAAQDAGATTGNALLRGTIGARPAALGGAYTAIADGPLALRYNPAGLSGEERSKIFFQYNASILDINRSDIAYSMPFWGGGLAVGFSTINYGSIVRTTTANKIGAGTFGANDYLLKIGYGRRVTERINFGANLGYYRFDLDDVSSSGIVADLGMSYEMSIQGLLVGASIRNIGSRTQFQREREELPLAFVLGGAYSPNRKLLVSLDYELAQSLGGAIKAGLEYSPLDMLALRIGFDGRNDAASGLTLGAGFRVSSLDIDYAFIPFGDFGNDHRVSVEWAFGARKEHTAPISTEQYRPRNPEPPSRVGRPKSPARPIVAQVSPPPEPAPQTEEELYRKAIRIDPYDGVALYNLATVRYLTGDYREARGLYETVTGIAPNDVDAWLYLGMCESKLGRPTRARHAFEQVVELDPRNTYARLMLEPQRGRER